MSLIPNLFRNLSIIILNQMKIVLNKILFKKFIIEIEMMQIFFYQIKKNKDIIKFS
jgi:hypothetical protein